jgi:hypothetical protein
MPAGEQAFFIDGLVGQPAFIHPANTAYQKHQGTSILTRVFF